MSNRRLNKVELWYIENKEGKRFKESVANMKPEAQEALNDFFDVYKNEKRTLTKEGSLQITIPTPYKLLGLDKKEVKQFTPKERVEDKCKLQCILVIGPEPHVGYHFSENLYSEAKKQGYIVQYLWENDLKVSLISQQEFITYENHDKRCPLSLMLKLCPFQPDLIVIDENSFIWENDTNIPVFYAQREFKREPKCSNPDVLLMWRQGFIDYFTSYTQSYYMNNIKNKKTIPLFVDLERFKPLEKRPIQGVTGIGNREAWNQESFENFKDLGELASFKIAVQEEIDFKACDLRYYNAPIDDKQYRNIMPQCEAVWIPNTTGQFLTHRMFECMASRVLCVIKLESKNHEEELKRLGFVNGEHYIGVREFTEIKPLFDKLSTKKKAEMANKTLSLVQEKYSNKNLVEFIANLYNELGYNKERFDVICPLYWVDEDLLNNNINNWFKEIPIRKLFVGINNPNAKIECNHPQLELIDQTKLKTLGACLKDLMERVETRWFVFLHADAEIMEHMFLAMKSFMASNVGIIESDRVEWGGDFREVNKQKVPLIDPYKSYFFRDRSFSGFQLFQKKAIEKLLSKIEDDFIYRMEDVVFQSNVIENGYEYKKTFCMHVHHIKQKKWTISEMETNTMSWKSLVKYTQPSSTTKYACLFTIKFCKENKEYGLTLSQIMFFCYEHNPNWGEVIRDHWLLWEQGLIGDYD